jgi:hypothetical protein
VTEVDFARNEVYSGSAMHELITRFRGAEFIKKPDYMRREYEWVLNAMGLDK